MNAAELNAECWEERFANPPPLVLVFDDGTKVYPSCDPEGNDYGCMFGVSSDGERFTFVSGVA
jgi:hypothetical protein